MVSYTCGQLSGAREPSPTRVSFVPYHETKHKGERCSVLRCRSARCPASGFWPDDDDDDGTARGKKRVSTTADSLAPTWPARPTTGAQTRWPPPGESVSRICSFTLPGSGFSITCKQAESFRQSVTGQCARRQLVFIHTHTHTHTSFRITLVQLTWFRATW